MNQRNRNESVINILERVRSNSIVLSNIHRSNYFSYKSVGNCFDIPVIIISTLSGSFSVGAREYLPQEQISLVTCATSMIITILSSIKLYLNLTQNLENESNMSREFYTLAVDIFKIVQLPLDQRGEDGLQYLNKKYGHYIKLVESSNLLRKRYKHDQLAVIKKELLLVDTSTISSGSSGYLSTIETNNEHVYEDEPEDNVVDPMTQAIERNLVNNLLL